MNLDLGSYIWSETLTWTYDEKGQILRNKKEIQILCKEVINHKRVLPNHHLTSSQVCSAWVWGSIFNINYLLLIQNLSANSNKSNDILLTVNKINFNYTWPKLMSIVSSLVEIVSSINWLKKVLVTKHVSIDCPPIAVTLCNGNREHVPFSRYIIYKRPFSYIAKVESFINDESFTNFQCRNITLTIFKICTHKNY